MKNIKAIFLDMDGTILHENNKASEYTKQVINELREQSFPCYWEILFRNQSACS